MDQKKAGVVLSYVNTGLSMITHLAYTPIMIRILGQSEYGLYTLVASIVSYLSLFSLGFNGSYMRFFARYKSQGDENAIKSLNGLFMTIFSFMGFTALIAGLILSMFPNELFGNKIDSNETQLAVVLLRILVVNIAISFPRTVFNSIVTAHERFIYSRLLTIANTVLNPLVCIPLLLLGYGSVALVSVSLALSIISIIIDGWYCFAKLQTKFNFHHMDKALLREISVFSFFIFINMLIDQLNWNLDKYILGRTCGTKEVAIYGVGTTFNTVIKGLATTVSGVFLPKVNFIVSNNTDNSDDQLSILLAKVGRIQYIIVLFVFGGFMLIGRAFVTWWAGINYAKAFYVALLLISPLILILPHGLGIEIRRAKNQHKLVAVIMLVTTIANALISIPLSRKYGSVGAALGTFLCLLVNLTWLDYYYTKRCHLKMKILYLNLFQITLSLTPALIIVILGLFVQDTRIQIALCIIYAIVYIAMLYHKGLNAQEKSQVNEEFKKFKYFVLRQRGNR